MPGDVQSARRGLRLRRTIRFHYHGHFSLSSVLPALVATAFRHYGSFIMSNFHPSKTVDDFVQLQHTVAAYHVLRTALRLGVVNELKSGQKTAAQIAASLELDWAATEMLLLALCQAGLAENYGEDYALSQIGHLLVDPFSLDDQHWSRLPDLVRLGSERFGTAQPTAADQLPTRIDSQQWLEAPAALDAAEVLDFGHSRRAFRVLEVGGGSAVMSTALAHRDPDSLFVVLDRAENLERARQTAGSVELENQFEFLEGNPREPDIEPGVFDLIIVSGQYHFVPEPTGPAWVQALARGLKPGGELAVIDWFGGQEKGFRSMVYHQLEVGLRFPGAKLNRPQMLREWMHAAGLTAVRYAHLPSPPHVWGLVLAEKPK